MGTPPLSVLKSNIETLIPKGKYLPSQMVTAALAWSQHLGTHSPGPQQTQWHKGLALALALESALPPDSQESIS